MEKMRSLEGGRTASRSAVGCLLCLHIFAALFPAVFGGKAVLGKEGSTILLPCSQEGNVKKEELQQWLKLEGSQSYLLLKRENDRTLLGNKIGNEKPLRFHLATRNINNRDFSLTVNSLKMEDGGVYECRVRNEVHKVHLYVFKLNPNPKNPLLSEDLSLTLETSSNRNLNVTWKDPKNNIFSTGEQTLWIRNLNKEHTGVWKCQIQHEQSDQDLEITHEVKAIGFFDPESRRKFSKVNETVMIPCKLSSDIKRKIETLQVLAAGVYKSDDPKSLGQQIKDVTIGEDGSCWKEDCGNNPPHHNFNDLSISLSTVQLSDAGWYTCLVNFSHRVIEKHHHLLIVRVSAEPQGPIIINTEVNLACQVSDSLPNSVLRWTHVNGSSANSKESRNTRLLTMTLRVNASYVGLWRCSVSVDGEVVFSMDHILEVISGRVNLWFWAAVGAGSIAILIVTICIVICAARVRRRRRAWRMARMRKQLYEQKTCQCKKRLPTTYYES